MMKKNLLLAILLFAMVACADKREQETTENLGVETTEVTTDPTHIS